MRLADNFYSEWTNVQKDSFGHTLFVTLVACAVGATAGAAVILSLVGALLVQRSVPSISPRVVARYTGTFETSNVVPDRPTEIAQRLVAISTKSDSDEPVT